MHICMCISFGMSFVSLCQPLWAWQEQRCHTFKSDEPKVIHMQLAAKLGAACARGIRGGQAW